MELSIGGGVKSSRSKGLQDFIAERFSYFGIGNFPSTVGRGQKINLSKAKVRFSGEGSDLSDSVKSLVSTVEKTAGLPRSQDFLLPRNDMSSKAAFTLAEVLITLGIIGVVAALTLPALIQNYQKHIALNKLKQTYAQISTGIEAVAAEFDTLPMHNWSCNEGWAEGQYNQENCFYLVFEKIGAKMYPQATETDKTMCYEGKPYNKYKYATNFGTEYATTDGFNTYSWSAQMPNGACVLWLAYAWTGSNAGKFFIDIDGPYKGYNTFGKDLFVFSYAAGHNGKGLGANGHSIYPTGFSYENGDPSRIKMPTSSQAAYGVEACVNGNRMNCAAYIMVNGWTMPKNYPWN